MDRDVSIDILRCIALIGIVVIHCEPESLWLRQIRNFDVPLMVFLSGVSYTLSIKCKNTLVNRGGYLKYVVKRFKRLILPTWIFLGIYCILFTIVTHKWIDYQFVLRNSFFYTGWYVWIIRVFFVISICAPFIYPLVRKTSLSKICVVAAVILIVYEGISQITDNYLYYLIVLNVPYILFFVLGSIMWRVRYKYVMLLLAVSVLLYTALAVVLFSVKGEYVLTSVYKYPPRLYYTSYAMMCILLLWTIRHKICDVLKFCRLKDFFVWIGSHTIWIYFWHIPLLDFAAKLNLSFVQRFLLVFGIALMITVSQNIIVDKIVQRLNNKDIVGNLRILFKG